MAGMFLKCACCVHALNVEKEDGEWSFAVWEWYPYGGKLGRKQRLRFIWQVLRRGLPYGEHVILKQADAIRLALHLLDAPEGAVWSANNANTTGSPFRLEA